MLSMFMSLFDTINGMFASIYAMVAPFLTFNIVAGVGLAALLVLYVTGWGTRILVAFYGSFTGAELLKFGLLSAAGYMVIGAYWTLRTTKDAFFDTLVGIQYQPYAKMLTVVAMIPIVMIFSKLVDRMSREKLFWVVCGFYMAMFTLFGILYNGGGTPLLSFSHPLVDWIPGHFLGWMSYVTIETLGGIIVSLLWSYIHSTTSTSLGKRGYPLINIAMQLGNFSGPTLVSQAEKIGFANLLYISAIVLGLVPVIINVYRSFVPEHLLQTDAAASNAPKKKNTGVMEGLRLIGKHKYLMGLAFVSTVYEVVGTILDFQFKYVARQSFSKEAYAAYLGGYGQWTAIMGILFAVLGTSIIIRKLGVRFSLLLYPTLLGLVVIGVRTFPFLNALFWAMVCVKMLSYTLNNPVKELMYIPTSKDVKFKVKSVIDGFGGKSSKGLGSMINAFFASTPAALMAYGTLISLGIVGSWIFIAIFVGQVYDDLIAKQQIID